MDLRPGDIVLVPLNRREEVGVVWDGRTGRRRAATTGCGRSSALIDGPPMRADLRRLVDWIAGYTLAPPGDVLAMALRINALRPEPPALGWQARRAGAGAPDRRRAARCWRRWPRAARRPRHWRGRPACRRAWCASMADAGLLVPVVR